MKTFLLLIGLLMSLLLQAQLSITVENTAGNLGTTLTAEELSSVTQLTITGTIDANDIATINNIMPALTTLDISQTTLSPCIVPSVSSFEANWFPGPSLSRNSLNYGGLMKPLLTSIQLPSTVEVLGSSAFEYSGITSIDIPATVTSIGWSAFARSALNSIFLPSSVTYLDEWVFDGCSSLIDVTIESYLTDIPQGTFAGCTSLKSVNIPSTVNHIGMSAFLNCNNLNSITLPETVNSIELTAFYGCSGLTAIYSNNPLPPQTQNSFGEVDKVNCILYVPFGSGELYRTASEWQEFTHIVEEPGLSLSSNSIALGSEINSSDTIQLHTQSSWTILSDQAWLTINPASGNNDETITFTAQANPSGSSRTAIATVSTNDGFSETVTVIQAAKPNTAPVAHAGNDLTVNEGETVQLDGSGSSDADNDVLSYQWTAPEGIELSLATAARPTFTAPQIDSNTTYNFTLVVNDGQEDSPSDMVFITVNNLVELSLSEKNVTLGAENSTASVSIHCNASWNASCNYDWLTISPESNNGDHILTITAQANPLYITRSAQVIVTTANSLSDTINITQQAMINTAPVANAGNDRHVYSGDVVQLDGSASSDIDNDALTYLWTAPVGIILSSSTDANPTFTAPQQEVQTTYTFSLTVNDGQLNSTPDQVIITVTTKVPEMNLSASSVTFERKESTARIIISGNVQWTASSDQPWLSVTPGSGTGDQMLVIAAQENNNFLERTGTITVSSPEVDSQTFVVTQEGLPVGTEETEAMAKIKYYPNPFSEKIFIEVANPTRKKVSVDIFTMTGQRVKSLVKQRNDESITINWNGTNDKGQLAPYGMYILKINETAKQVVFKGR